MPILPGSGKHPGDLSCDVLILHCSGGTCLADCGARPGFLLQAEFLELVGYGHSAKRKIFSSQSPQQEKCTNYRGIGLAPSCSDNDVSSRCCMYGDLHYKLEGHHPVAVQNQFWPPDFASLHWPPYQRTPRKSAKPPHSWAFPQ